MLDVVAQLAPGLDGFYQFGHAFRIEPVRRIEKFQVRLVQVRDGNRFKLKSVLRERSLGALFEPFLHLFAFFMHFIERHLGCGRPQRTHEFPREQFRQLFRVGGPPAQGGRRRGDKLGPLNDPDEKFNLNVNAHAVSRNNRVLPHSGHRNADHVEIDLDDFVNNRQNEGAAVDDNLFTAEARPDKRHFPVGPVIQPVEQIRRDHDNEDGDNQP